MLVSNSTGKSTVCFNVLGKKFGQLCIEALCYLLSSSVVVVIIDHILISFQ